MTNDCVSICTMENLVYCKFAPPKLGSLQYALFLVSGVTAASESRNISFMIEYVEAIGSDAIEDYKRVLRKLATLAKGVTFAATPAKSIVVTIADTIPSEKSEETRTESDRCKFAGHHSIHDNVKSLSLRGCFRAQLR